MISKWLVLNSTLMKPSMNYFDEMGHGWVTEEEEIEFS